MFTSHHHFPMVDVPGPSRKAYRLAWQYSRGDPRLQNFGGSLQVYIYIYAFLLFVFVRVDFLYRFCHLFEQGLEILATCIMSLLHEPPLHLAQESCTEIINSAIADVRDAVDSFRTNSSRLCPVISELSRIRHDDSEPCPNISRTGRSYGVIDISFRSLIPISSNI